MQHERIASNRGIAMTEAVLSFSELNPENHDYGVSMPKGKMRKYIGKVYDVQDWLKLSYRKCSLDRQERKKAYLLRAFEVLPLIKETLTCQGLSDIQHSLERLLKDKMPGIRWRADEEWYLPLLKYLILHGSLPAPIDALTGNNMSIEIYGRLVNYDGRPSVDVANEYKLLFYKLMEKEITVPQLEECLSATMAFRIESATYANVQYSGIRVPFYL